MPTPCINFTKTELQNLPIPDLGKRTTYRDQTVKGLSIRCTQNAKTFYLVKWVNGKTERICLGRFPGLSVENARKKAMALLGQIATGENPNEAKRTYKDGITLGELFDAYMERHSKPHKLSWEYDQREITKFLSMWFNKKASEIKTGAVREVIERIYRDNGKTQANRLLERISSMYNKGIEWELVNLNPAVGIKKYSEEKRDRFLLPNEMPHFVRALEEEENETLKDYIWIALLTGVRKTNVMKMRWEQIFWELMQWRIPRPKNGEPLIVILHPKAINILKKRYSKSKSPWVFTKQDDQTQPLSYHEKAIRRVREKATIYSWLANPQYAEWLKPIHASLPRYYNSGTGYKKIMKRAEEEKIELPISLMNFRFHDIRRTLGSYQAINGTSLEIIGKSLGHKSLQSTQIYARLILDPVKKSVESAIDKMMDMAGQNMSV